jgi:hypothetical protein
MQARCAVPERAAPIARIAIECEKRSDADEITREAVPRIRNLPSPITPTQRPKERAIKTGKSA